MNPLTWWVREMRGLTNEEGLAGLFIGAMLTLGFIILGIGAIGLMWSLLYTGVVGIIVALGIIAFVVTICWIYKTRDRE